MVAGERRGWCQDLGKWGGGRERERVALHGRETSSSPASVCLGDEEAQCRSKDIVLCFLFLFVFLNVSFHLKGKGTKTC